MDKLKFVLKVWTKLSSHIRVRDRSVKILQYGCQMLLGFYGAQFSKEVIQGLKHTKSMASSSRKAFWLLKSFNHVGTIITMIETYSHASDECYANLLDILEQLFLIIYYFYENLVFISRTKLVWFTEDMLDDWGNWSWFFEDFLCFAASLMRTYISHRNWSRHTVENYCDNQHVDIGKGHAKYPKPALSGRRLVESNDLRRKLVDSSLSMTIAALELGASAEAVDLFRTFFGTPIGDTGMGLCGVASSVLILFEAAIAAVREEGSTAVVVEVAVQSEREGLVPVSTLDAES